MIAGAALLAVLLLFQKGAARRRGAYALAVVAIVLVGGYGASLLAGEVTRPPRSERRASPILFSDDSVTTRFDRWGNTLDKVADDPLGTGLGTVGRATARGRVTQFTDNSYLKVLQEQGVLGGLLFVGGLLGLFVALALRLVRQDPSRRALGTAGLAAFCGFAVLMVMGEYIEQPGKLLAWTLLGVTAWEILGRPRSEADPPSYEYPAWGPIRRRIATVQSQARRLPRPVLGALLAAVVVVVAVPIAIRAASTSDYQSSTHLLSAPSGSNARWESTVRRLVKDPGFLRPTAEDGTISASELPGHLSVRFVHGQRLKYSVVARADTPKEARRVASATGKTLVGATYFWRTAALNSKQRSLRGGAASGGWGERSRPGRHPGPEQAPEALDGRDRAVPSSARDGLAASRRRESSTELPTDLPGGRPCLSLA